MHYLDYKLDSKTSLYKTVFSDGLVVWKAINFQDFKKYREARNLLGETVDLAMEEKLFRENVLYSSYDPIEDQFPVEIKTEFQKVLWIEKCRDELPAGIVSTVVKDMLSHCGAISPHQLLGQLDEHRDYINNIEDQIVLRICQAFPAYKPEDIDAMDWHTVLKRAAQAETVLGYYFELDDPEARAKEAEKKQRLNLDKEIREVNRAIEGGNGPSEEDIAKQEEWKAEQRRKKQEYMQRRGK